MSDRRARLASAATALTLALASGATAAEAPSGADLARAAGDNDLAAVTALLARRAPVDFVDEDGATALAWAARNANTPMAEALLKAGADANRVNDYGVGPLLVAAQLGDAALVRALLTGGADPNLATWNRETPLMHAARAGSAQAVEALLTAGAQVDAREGRDGQTALMWAAASGRSAAVRALLAAGADPALKTPTLVVQYPRRGPGDFLDGTAPVTKGGFSALMFAVQSGDVDSARLLLDAGQDVNQTSADGVTPLILSLYRHANPQPDFPLITEVVGDVPMARLLLERGADPNKAESHGLTPLHAAVFVAHGHDHMGSLTDVPTVLRPHDSVGEEAVRLLLAHGADPNLEIADYSITSPAGQDPRGAARYANVSPFMLAGAVNKPALLKMMLDSGRIDVDARLRNGGTLLTTAVSLNQLAAVEALIAAGADVNAPDARGDTPLHLAAANRPGSGAIANALLEAGARLNLRNAEGRTAVELATGAAEAAPRPRAAGPSADPLIQLRGAPQMFGTVAREVIAVRLAGGAFPKENLRVTIGQRELPPELQRRDQVIVARPSPAP